MSTDILRFDPDRLFSLQALKYFLVITLPLMVMTFAVAYGIHGVERGRVKRRSEERHTHELIEMPGLNA